MVLDTLKNNVSTPLPVAALALFFAVSIGAGDTFAQNAQTSFFQISGDDPININADKFEVDDSTNLITFTGNVVAIQNVNQIKAGKMTVRYAGGSAGLAAGGGEIEHIDLSDNIQLNTDTQTATGDTGYFDIPSQHFVLQGDRVVLTEGDNVFVGCKLTVNMVTSKANLDACGGRVQIKLDPKSRPGN